MKITKVSPLTGKENTMDLNVTPEQLSAWRSGVLIQVAMPHLSDAEREFIKTGYTQSDWDTIFPQEEEE